MRGGASDVRRSNARLQSRRPHLSARAIQAGGQELAQLLQGQGLKALRHKLGGVERGGGGAVLEGGQQAVKVGSHGCINNAKRIRCCEPTQPGTTTVVKKRTSTGKVKPPVIPVPQ